MMGVKQEEDVVSQNTSPRAVSKTLLGPQKGLGTQRAVWGLGPQRGLGDLTQLDEGRNSLLSWGPLGCYGNVGDIQRKMSRGSLPN